MSTIKVANYRNIAAAYTSAVQQVTGVSDFYFDAVYEIVRLTVVTPTVDLMDPVFTAYLAADTFYASTPQAVINAVGAMQRHVLTNARTHLSERFTDINQWIDAAGTNDPTNNDLVGRKDDPDDTSFTVSAEFASISARAGFAIDDANIS